MLRIIVVMLLAMLSAQASYAGDRDVATTSFLDGNWDGTLTDVAPMPGEAPDFRVRLHIQGQAAEVFVLQKDGQWKEYKPGKFRAFQNNFSAIVFASDSSRGTCWDETLSYALALDAANQLLAKFSRVVSNARCMTANSKSFGVQSAGVFTQQATATVR